MLSYFAELLALRKKNPTDDLMTAMMEAATDDGEIMSPFEILATAIELIVAGHETTVNTVVEIDLFSVARRELGIDCRESGPADRRRRRGTAALDLASPAPTQPVGDRTARAPRQSCLNVGDAVVVMLGAANYDPAMFPDPAKLDFTRPAARHMTFVTARTCASAPTWRAWR